MNTEESSIRQSLVKTNLYYFLLRARSIYEYAAVQMFDKLFQKRQPGTSYCISPYKTGTTYITGLFRTTCRAAHEPLQFTTLLNIDNNDFLLKRMRYLNLDIECSGFFAGRLDQVRLFAPTAPILMISRSPEAWIRSVINYFEKLGERVSYNYVARLVFDPICREHIEDFYGLTSMKQASVVTSLLEYWIRIYKEGQDDRNTLIIPLEQIDKRIKQVEAFLGHNSHPVRNPKWKRVNTKKKPFCLRDYVDLTPYETDVKALGYEL